MAAKLIAVESSFYQWLSIESVKPELTNNGSGDLIIDIGRGLIFQPRFASCQDIVLLGTEKMALAPLPGHSISPS